MLVLQFNEGTNPPSITLYHRFAYSNDCNNSCVRDTPILHFLTVLKRGCFGGVLARRLITNFLPRQTVKHPLCLSRPSWAPRCLPSYNLGGAAHASCIIIPLQIPRVKYKYKIPTNTNVKQIQLSTLHKQINLKSPWANTNRTSNKYKLLLSFNLGGTTCPMHHHCTQ